ncbi:MAG: hypothetical protein AAF456_14660 [Planctomycetota bacterium]
MTPPQPETPVELARPRPFWKTLVSAILIAVSPALLIYFLGALAWPIERRWEVYTLTTIFVVVACAGFTIERLTGRKMIAAISIAIPFLAALPVGIVLAMSLTPSVGPFGGPAYASPVIPHVIAFAFSVLCAAICCLLEQRGRSWYFAISPVALLALLYSIWLVFRIVQPT